MFLTFVQTVNTSWELTSHTLCTVLCFPLVEIYADTVIGDFNLIANGGDGYKGQDGGPGEDAANSRVVVCWKAFCCL